MAERFGSYADFGGFTADQIADMTPNEKVDLMVEWFKHQFEDPQNDTPYVKDHGGYLYLWGGPFDASDQIQAEFSNAIDFDTMMLAVDRVQADGVVEWAPQTGGDFYEHPEDEEDGVATGAVVDGDGEWPPVIPVPQPIPPEPEARAEVLLRLDELENLLQPLIERVRIEAQASAMMGHNNPPEPMEIAQAVTREEWLQVQTAVEAIRQQAQSEQPNIVTVTRSNRRLVAAATALARWLGGRLNAIIDAGLVGAAGYAAINPEAALAALTQAANAVQVWIASLPWPL